MRDLIQALREEDCLISDGGLGTMLQARGLAVGASPELWNLTHPDDVLGVHQAYVNAGAEFITTNSFGGSRHKLAQFDAAGQFQQVNAKAVELARQAADDKAWVWGSMGPVGVLMEPYGELTSTHAAELFGELSQALAQSGADALLFETFYDLAELEVAVSAGKSIGLPVLATMTFDETGRTMMGVRASEAWQAVADWGLAAFGANCSTGPEQMVPVVESIIQAGAPCVIAQPNAGMPERQADGSVVYRESPDSFARFARVFREAGCKILGGCCGSTPEHVRSIRTALKLSR